MHHIKPAVLIVTIILSVLTLSADAEHIIDDSKNPRYQFVFSSVTGSFKDGKLTLKGVPIVTFYSLGVKRWDGHFLLKEFVRMWNNDARVLKTDPPNGTLSVLSDKGSSGAVIELSEPETTINTITFKARILEGKLPAAFGPSSLFLELTVSAPLHTEN